MAGLEDRKAELIAELNRARVLLGNSASEIRDRVDVPRRMRRSIERKKWMWLGGAVLFGVLLAKLPARKKTVVVDQKGKRMPTAAKAGLALTMLKFGFDLARPMLSAWLQERVIDYLTRRNGAERE